MDVNIHVDFRREPPSALSPLPVSSDAAVERSFSKGNFGLDIKVVDGSEGFHLASFLRTLGFK